MESLIPPILQLNHISFRRGQRPILTDLSWSVAPGALAAVVGPNGCGKLTLLRLIAGYLWPAAGSISLLGHQLGEFPLEDLRARTGIVEATALYPFDDAMTALDVVCSGYSSLLTLNYRRPSKAQWEHARHCLSQVSLGARTAQPYSTLSTGERMRCLIARALVRKPELVLLDEPTAGLDLPAREAVLATLTRLHHASAASRAPAGASRRGACARPGSRLRSRRPARHRDRHPSSGRTAARHLEYPPPWGGRAHGCRRPAVACADECPHDRGVQLSHSRAAAARALSSPREPAVMAGPAGVKWHGRMGVRRRRHGPGSRRRQRWCGRWCSWRSRWRGKWRRRSAPRRGRSGPWGYGP